MQTRALNPLLTKAFAYHLVAICLVSVSVNRCTLIIHTQIHTHTYTYTLIQQIHPMIWQLPVALLNMCKLCGINYYALCVIFDYQNCSYILSLQHANASYPFLFLSLSLSLFLTLFFPLYTFRSTRVLATRNTSTTLPGRQVVPVTIYHLSMTHAYHTHTHSHTHYAHYCILPLSSSVTVCVSVIVCVGRRQKHLTCSLCLPQDLLQEIHICRVRIGMLRRKPTTPTTIKRASRRTNCCKWAWPCGKSKSKSSSKTKLDYFVRSEV